ncbi:hypothetical protein [Limnoglobus roseus]|uniref:Uncharacterized protein n=1 Tax=Limnoglobus roseus TaxID=2598579 RepID=A0A5C1AJB8_9BACT|nr:hypothetical protein [Limnoglobus roseus]QEL19281.1 hypothetical protein PX52LOC_06344 [Limnoglobus roseus]
MSDKWPNHCPRCVKADIAADKAVNLALKLPAILVLSPEQRLLVIAGYFAQAVEEAIQAKPVWTFPPYSSN